jgi:hypothetical protein
MSLFLGWIPNILSGGIALLRFGSWLWLFNAQAMQLEPQRTDQPVQQLGPDPIPEQPQQPQPRRKELKLH